eukprot:5919510-Amphidinium_carterae.1
MVRDFFETGSPGTKCAGACKYFTTFTPEEQVGGGAGQGIWHVSPCLGWPQMEPQSDKMASWALDGELLYGPRAPASSAYPKL